MEEMKYITFYRENNQFEDIRQDPILKKAIYEQTKWYQHLTLGIKDDDKIFSYVALKYGDELRTKLTKDFTPIPNIDYTPKRR
jgi:hypothetical protein